MQKHLKRYRLLGVLVATLVAFNGVTLGTVQAQSPRRISPSAVTMQVYEQLPELALENQYISSDGEIDVDNTLVSRIIRYHLYIRNRPTNLRLDWKLTMADYLGAFEQISPEEYPDYGLRENPMAGDITAVENLSVGMRDHLTNLLYEAFASTPTASTTNLSATDLSATAPLTTSS
ncbi:hypothetical protein [cf. Phormidesmis sp. LEGE 11477]|uniref:hypothetical protein n=1 Tax=cf. Phormidesmis sp. LEGE 11477 TaxID=1828680 RepID=UPI001881445A|nr:hypothetical protein [cf. Phormidesmis sp. LEGE 11477]MBE9063310.1 hypothetical protein [cf. Phormidesmis sp. LEGE 11477]